MNASQQSEIVSILSAGTFFGALLSAPLADMLGRRWAMIFNTGVFTFGVILQTVATRIPLFVAGRFFAGLVSPLSRIISDNRFLDFCVDGRGLRPKETSAL